MDQARKLSKVNTKVVKGKQIICIRPLNLQAKQQLITQNDMRKIVTCLLLLASALLNPIITNAADNDKVILILHFPKYSDIDPDEGCPILQKSPIHIPLQASYDTHYIYVSSQASISGKYVVANSNEGMALEGIFTATPGEEQKINISSLPEGEYKLKVMFGELTLEGDFNVEK